MKRVVAVLLLLCGAAVFLSGQDGEPTEAPAEAPAEAAANGSEPDPLLYAIGAVGVANLYFSYSFLGSVADGLPRASTMP